jgi:TPR repeat protein
VPRYHRAAENDNAEAQTALGLIYGKGDGVALDAATSIHWYRQAAEQGFVPAMHPLAVVLLRGTVTEQAEAHTWLFVASALGSGPARNLLGTLEGQMTREQITAAEKSARRRIELLPAKD